MKTEAHTTTSANWGWLGALLLWLYYVTPVLIPRPTFPWAMLALGLGTGLLCAILLTQRHHRPVLAVVVISATLALSPSSLGAALFAQFHVARHGQRSTAALTAAAIVAAKTIGLLAGPWSDGWTGASTFELTLAVAGVVIVTLAGLLAQSRAAESHSRTAAEGARYEAEQARIEQARLAERERIAREMHDALAHRLSLVAMHAGALAFRTDLDAETARDTAKLINANAKLSLDELRLVLADLRTDDGPEPPQPTLAQLPVLIAEATAGGQQIIVRGQIDPNLVPPMISRQAYRVVQEALTNARKHAPGAPVTLSVESTPEGSLNIQASNPVTPLAPADASGSRLGLVGVAERAAGVGGSASHGLAGDQFALDVTMPLAAR